MVDYAGATVVWSGGTTTLLERTKKALNITDSSQDEDISLYLDLAGTSCEAYMDNKIVSQPVVESYAFSQTPIPLRFYPASDLTSVIIDGLETVDDWELFTTDGITYALSDRYSTIRSGHFNQLTISYTAGYDPVPSDLGYVLVLTAISYKDQTSGTGTIKKEVINNVGSVEYAIADQLTGAVGLISAPSVSVLNRYRRWHV
jgi:hypothetical protein